ILERRIAHFIDHFIRTCSEPSLSRQANPESRQANPEEIQNSKGFPENFNGANRTINK
ncbi:hypothetical protein L9F63_010462, partial [Diploptera punctata]